ncbi:glycosyl hydrolase [Solidesulfovibrio sp.]|uniref:glycosyl hydrolase n=1 Tax=Solidesulfovibrio sp. TaxID=2910990 RepID=UPI002614397F|nr:glycosyl hydrolase [Solidesulfovibrio sp.]
MGRHQLHILKIIQAACRGLPLAAALVCAALFLVAPARATAAGTEITTWIADWDLARGLTEWRAHQGLFDSVRVFSASFDEKDRPALSPDWARVLGRDAAAVFGGTPAYLTVVNDVVTPSGKGNKLKDPGLVSRLLATPDSRSRHLDALLSLARDSRFQGLEIDYENVAEADWPAFLDFVAALWQRANASGLRLSVLLQPQRRYLSRPLPPGPQYVLMGYNLYGFHSGPGPKATPAFLAEQAAALRALGALSSTTLALATGGFDWTGPKAARQLTEAEARALLAQQAAAPTRSAGDGYLVARYRDGTGKDHEVWHADGQTLGTLWQAGRQAGFAGLAVWRLGGNTPSLFEFLSSLRK